MNKKRVVNILDKFNLLDGEYCILGSTSSDLKYERYGDFLLQNINNLLQNMKNRGLKKDIKDIAIIKAYLERRNI